MSPIIITKTLPLNKKRLCFFQVHYQALRNLKPEDSDSMISMLIKNISRYVRDNSKKKGIEN